jgi:hypothetical protein
VASCLDARPTRGALGRRPSDTSLGGVFESSSIARRCSRSRCSACASPAQHRPAGSTRTTSRSRSGKQLEQLARSGFDMTEARPRHTVEIAATDRQAKELRSLGLDPNRKTTGGVSARQRAARVQRVGRLVGRLPPYFDADHVGSVNPDGTGGHGRRFPRSSRHWARQPGPREVRDHRPHDRRQADPRAQGHQGRAARSPTGRGPRRCTPPRSTHASGWRRRAGGGWRTCSSRTTAARAGPERGRRPDRRRHQGSRSPRSSRRTSCGSSSVANPDGYDYTFTPGNRLWRKNLRDNNNDGKITAGSGRRGPEPQLTRPSGSTTRRAPRGLRERDLPRPGPSSEPRRRRFDGC